MKDSFAKISEIQNAVGLPSARVNVMSAIVGRAAPYTLESDINVTAPRQPADDNPIFKLMMSMKAGQSFFAENIEGIEPKKLRASISSIAKKVQATPGSMRWEFVSRRVKENGKTGFRFWRSK